MLVQTIKPHTLGRARSPLRAAARWGQRALPPVAAAIVLALPGVFLARTAFAKITVNTIDPVAVVGEHGRQVLLSGPLAVTAGERGGGGGGGRVAGDGDNESLGGGGAHGGVGGFCVGAGGGDGVGGDLRGERGDRRASVAGEHRGGGGVRQAATCNRVSGL